MAKCTIKMPEEFLMKISKLGSKTDEIVPKVLTAGASVIEDNIRTNLRSVIGKDLKTKSRSTGQLLSSLGTSHALQDKNGDFNVRVGFSEKRTDGESNAKIASVIEHGKTGQAPKPFIKPALSKSKKACVAAMESKFDEEVSRI